MQGIECPHCSVSIHVSWESGILDEDVDGLWLVQHATCSSCARVIVGIVQAKAAREAGSGEYIGITPLSTRFVRPLVKGRPFPSGDVPKSIADLYSESGAVLALSARASAALSRRCLQEMLHEHVGIKGRTLDAEIDALLKQGTLPSHIAESVDAIRTIGNFAAHPIKSTASGEIVDVEPGEAEWLLDVLDLLFDHVFVQPAVTKRKRDALNEKLKAAGKPPLK